MNVHVPSANPEFAQFLHAQQKKSVLRFMTCGSVDDGKSTLIGRLLYDSRQVFDDQLDALRRESRRSAASGRDVDFALLVDGLSAEREQGITIDVAYRFFATARRTFIVADTPGHEQYTRNMATGASNSSLAVLLVDARTGLTRQTRRHSLVVSMLGVRGLVLAVNKMDLIGWSQSRFEAIVAEYAEFAAATGFDAVTAIPLSALNGDNVVQPAVAAPWYTGPTLLGYLETVEPARPAAAGACLPVQWVNRPDAAFRGYAGSVAGGVLASGEEVRVLPSGRSTRIGRIVTADCDLDAAVAGQSVTLTLADDLDVSRGDVIAAPDAPIRIAEAIGARLFWAADAPLTEGARFYLKLATATAVARVSAIHRRIDPNSAAAEPATALAANDIGDVTLVLDRPLAVATCADIRALGSFILIDRESADTAALGLVLDTAPEH
jgi:sulfate adenylyltransferase subunit 1